MLYAECLPYSVSLEFWYMLCLHHQLPVRNPWALSLYRAFPTAFHIVSRHNSLLEESSRLHQTGRLALLLDLSRLPLPTADFAFCPLSVINLSHEYGNKLSPVSPPYIFFFRIFPFQKYSLLLLLLLLLVSHFSRV